jgi:hypothetical protein
MFQDAKHGVLAFQPRLNGMSEENQDRLAGTLTAQARNAGILQIHRIDMTDDNSRIFATDTPAAHQRVAFTDVVPGMQQSLVASTQQVDLANTRVAEQTAQQKALQPTLENPVRAANLS